jgi:hypothetical protein
MTIVRTGYRQPEYFGKGPCANLKLAMENEVPRRGDTTHVIGRRAKSGRGIRKASRLSNQHAAKLDQFKASQQRSNRRPAPDCVLTQRKETSLPNKRCISWQTQAERGLSCVRLNRTSASAGPRRGCAERPSRRITMLRITERRCPRHQQ